MLDIFNGTAYLLGSPAGCLSYNKWGRPNPPYVIFKYAGGKWERIPLEELPAEFKRPNLLSSSPDEVARNKAHAGLVTAETVRQENEEYRQPEFRSILREGVRADMGLTSCEELVRYKCGWGAPGEFNRKYFENACK